VAGGLFLLPQHCGGSAELGGTFVVVFCAVEGGHPFQAPGGIGGIAKPAIKTKTFSVACSGQWIILLRTHQGTFLGLAPTGKHITQTSIHIFRFADGQLVEAWANRDDLGLMQQLGVIPVSAHEHMPES
jgi:hypothetical protein